MTQRWLREPGLNLSAVSCCNLTQRQAHYYRHVSGRYQMVHCGIGSSWRTNVAASSAATSPRRHIAPCRMPRNPGETKMCSTLPRKSAQSAQTGSSKFLASGMSHTVDCHCHVGTRLVISRHFFISFDKKIVVFPVNPDALSQGIHATAVSITLMPDE